MSIHTNWLGEFFKHSLLLAGAVVVLLPFYLMLSYSLKSPSEIETNTGGFFGAQQIMTDNRCVKAGNPEENCLMRPIVYNYTAAFKEAPLVRHTYQLQLDQDRLHQLKHRPLRELEQN